MPTWIKLSVGLITGLHLFLIYILISSMQWITVMGYVSGGSYGMLVGCILTLYLAGIIDE